MVRVLNFYYASSYTNETLKVIVPIENGMAITNAFCPQSLEVGNSSIFLKKMAETGSPSELLRFNLSTF